jgi:hypothetical protein
VSHNRAAPPVGTREGLRTLHVLARSGHCFALSVRVTTVPGMVGADGSGLAAARGARWLPAVRLRSIHEAARFVEDVGFALLFPTDRAVAPSLWEAVAGPDATPFATGMGAAESLVWSWKDLLPEAGFAWCGRYVHGRTSLLSPRLLAALYPGHGEPDDHRTFSLPQEAHEIAEALYVGPLPSSALRELTGHRGRYDRAIRELQRRLLVTSAGVREQRRGWPAVLLELTCRRFDVGRADQRHATTRFLNTMIEATPAELARVYQWPTAVARAALDHLVATGLAERSPGGYRGTGRGGTSPPAAACSAQ